MAFLLAIPACQTAHLPPSDGPGTRLETQEHNHGSRSKLRNSRFRHKIVILPTHVFQDTVPKKAPRVQDPSDVPAHSAQITCLLLPSQTINSHSPRRAVLLKGARLFVYATRRPVRASRGAALSMNALCQADRQSLSH